MPLLPECARLGIQALHSAPILLIPPNARIIKFRSPLLRKLGMSEYFLINFRDKLPYFINVTQKKNVSLLQMIF